MSAARPRDLSIVNRLPDGLLDCDAAELHAVLHGPTLICLPGRRPDALFVSVLLHGNEPTGFDAVRDLLRDRGAADLPRNLVWFIGNVHAARHRVRTQEGQTDYNRAWPGTDQPDTAEARMLLEVCNAVRGMKPFASIDIHNNTGVNPHYACVNRLDARFLQLARLFSRAVVYFLRPKGVQSAAFAGMCPAVTIECGKAGIDANTRRAREFVEACLALDHLPERPVAEGDIELFRTFAIARVPAQASFSFDGTPADFEFRSDLETLNFREIARGTVLGRITRDPGVRLEVLPGGGMAAVEDATSGCLDDYLDYRDGEVRLAQSVIPSMLTRDAQAIRKDCLGYFMHRIDRAGRRLHE